MEQYPMHWLENTDYELMVIEFLSVSESKQFYLEIFINQSAKKYYNLETSGLHFEKNISPTKMCDYILHQNDVYYTCATCSYLPGSVICEKCWNENNHVGHNYRKCVLSSDEATCDCGTPSIYYDGFCDTHKSIYNHTYSSLLHESKVLQWYETYCHFCIYALFYYTKISTDKYRFRKAISIMNSLILLCESDLSIYTYICTFFSSSIKKQKSLFNSKIVDIDRSFLTLITIKDQAPYICILFIMCSICEDQNYQEIYQSFLLLLFKNSTFLNIYINLYPSILCSDIYSIYGNYLLSLDIQQTLLFIYHISLNQFIYLYHFMSSPNYFISDILLSVFNNRLLLHYLSIIEYYGIILQIVPMLFNLSDPLLLFFWYIYKGYNYLENKQENIILNTLYNDINQSMNMFSLININIYDESICPYVTPSFLMRLLICICSDSSYTLDSYFIQKNKLSLPFLYGDSPNSPIILTDLNLPLITRDTPILSTNFLNNNPDSIYIPSVSIISKLFANSNLFLSFLQCSINYINTNNINEKIIIIELLHVIYIYIRNTTIDPLELWKNSQINNLLLKLTTNGITINIKNYSALIQLLLQSHKLYSTLYDEYKTFIQQQVLVLNEKSKDIIENDTITCSVCNKKNGFFVLPAYINIQNQQVDTTNSKYKSFYSIYNYIFRCYHDSVIGGGFFDYIIHSCNHAIHFECLLKLYIEPGCSLNHAISCPKCKSLSNFMIPLFNSNMFFHSDNEENEDQIYNRYKPLYENIKNSHRTFYGLTCSSNPKDIDIKYYAMISCFLQNNMNTPDYKYFNSMIYDLFSESVCSFEYLTRFSLLTNNQQCQLLYTRNFMMILFRILFHSSYLPSHCIHQTSFLHFYIYITNTYTTPFGLCDIGTINQDIPMDQFTINNSNLFIELKYNIHLRLIGNLLDYYYLWNDKTLYNREKEKENIQRDRELLYVDENEVAFQYINIPIDDYYKEEYQQYIQAMKNSKDIYSHSIPSSINTLFPLFYKDYKPSIQNNREYGYIFERYRFRYINILHCRNKILEPAIQNIIRIPYNDYDSIYSPSLEIPVSTINIYKSTHSIISIDIDLKLKQVENIFRMRDNYRYVYLPVIIHLMEELYIYYEDIVCNYKQSNIRYIYMTLATIFHYLPPHLSVSSLPYTIPREYKRLSSLYSKPLEYHEIIKYCYIMEDLLLFKPLLTQMTQNYMSIFSKESIISLLIYHENSPLTSNIYRNNNHNISSVNNIPTSICTYKNIIDIMNIPSYSILNPIINSSIHSILSSSFIDITSDNYYHFIYFYLIILVSIELCKFTILNEPEYHYNPDYPIIWNKEINKHDPINSKSMNTNSTKQSNYLSNQLFFFSKDNPTYNHFYNDLKTLLLQRIPKVFSKEYIEQYKNQLYPFIQQSQNEDYVRLYLNYSKNQMSSDISHYKNPLYYSSIHISSRSIIEYIQLFFELYEVEIDNITCFNLIFKLFTKEVSIQQIFKTCSIDSLFVEYLYTFIGSITRRTECFPSYIHSDTYFSLLQSTHMNIDTISGTIETLKRVKTYNIYIENYMKDFLKSKDPVKSDITINILAHNSIIIKPRNIAKEFIDYLFCQFPLGNNEDDEDIFCFFNYARKWETRDVYVYEEIPFEEEITHMLLEQGIEYTVQQLLIPFMRSLYLLNIILSPSFIPSSDISVPTSFSSLYTSLSLSSSPSLSSLLEKKPCEYTIEEVLNIINLKVLELYEIPNYFFILSFDPYLKQCEYPLLQTLFNLTETDTKKLSFNYICNQCNNKDFESICICVNCGQTVCFSTHYKKDCMKQYLMDNINFCHCSIFIQLYTGILYYFGREDCFDLTHSLLLEEMDIEIKTEKEIRELAIQEITSLLNNNDISQRNKYINKMEIVETALCYLLFIHNIQTF
ncbi:hypothetical protein WA158_004723 [Blastocystis sp. Blastoise]